MSICQNFEGALMKALRSLEQHVDSLLSYDYSKLSEEELIEKLKRSGRQKNLQDCRSISPWDRHGNYPRDYKD